MLTVLCAGNDMNDRRLIDDYLPLDVLNSRTLSEESREGNFQEHSREEIGRIMPWLDEAPEDI